MNGFITNIKKLQLKSLKESTGNPQKMDDKTFTGLIDSIKRKGWYFAMPDVWEFEPGKYKIISGHHRIMAGIKAGLIEQNCNVITDPNYTEEQARKDLLESNERHGNPDEDLLTDYVTDLIDEFDLNADELSIDIGIDDSILNNILIQDDEKDDEVPEVPEVAFSKLGDLYLLNGHRVLCGDSTDEAQVEVLMDGKKANLIMTSPPYWVGKEYETQNSEDEVNEFILKIIDSFGLVIDINCSRIVINSGTGMGTRLKEKNSRVILLLDKWINGLFKNDWYLRSIRHWIKGGGSAGPISAKADFVYSGMEYLMTFYNTCGNQRGQNKILQSWAQQPNWNDIKGDKQENKAGFPVELPLRFILLYSLKDEIVADIFLGNGTTLISSEKTNRTCYGMELDPHYIDVIIKRYINYTGNKDNCYLIRDGNKIPLSDIKEFNNG